MRRVNELKVNNSPTDLVVAENSKRINCQISYSLIIKCETFLKSRHLAGNYHYSSMSDLIRKSLLSYKNEELTLNTPRPGCRERKKTVGIILPLELWEYYRGLPERFRNSILESCLVNYLNQI